MTCTAAIHWGAMAALRPHWAALTSSIFIQGEKDTLGHSSSSSSSSLKLKLLIVSESLNLTVELNANG